jgi:hypothetical protein
MPFIANPRDEDVYPLSLRRVQHASKVRTEQVGAGVLVVDPGIQDFGCKAPFPTRAPCSGVASTL